MKVTTQHDAPRTVLKNATIVNEGRITSGDIAIAGDRIQQVASSISVRATDKVVDVAQCWVLPGMIDDQVHFREPGLTHKGSIATESLAAVAGGITSFMEMPNVKPSTTTVAALRDKHAIAKQHSAANYSFYLGATPDNIEDIKAVDPSWVCGVKVFMGASTGDLLVEHPAALDAIFRECPTLIATHCENGAVIQQNQQRLRTADTPFEIGDHPKIRDHNACYQSSSYAVSLAKKHGSKLHVLHLTTAEEMSLFEPGPIEGKQITAEACVHHLWFSEAAYPSLGNLIKCNPAIKSEADRLALLQALRDDRIDIIATDHAPHTWQEKQQAYETAPAGLPLVQHALPSLIEQVKQGALSLTQVVKKISHNPAIRYGVKERGFIREGYFADLVVIAPECPSPATHENARCRVNWTPFVGHTFSSRIKATFVNGHCVYTDQSPNTFTATPDDESDFASKIRGQIHFQAGLAQPLQFEH